MQIANSFVFIFSFWFYNTHIIFAMGNCATNARIYAITDEEENAIGYRNAIASEYEGTYLDEAELYKIKSYNENLKHNNSFATLEDNERIQDMMDKLNDEIYENRMTVMDA